MHPAALEEPDLLSIGTHNEAGEPPNVFSMSSTARLSRSAEIQRSIAYMSLVRVECYSGGFFS